jgi:hypothetical protein
MGGYFLCDNNYHADEDLSRDRDISMAANKMLNIFCPVANLSIGHYENVAPLDDRQRRRQSVDDQ